MTTPLLEIDNLHVEFKTRRSTVAAVNGLSYAVSAGETLAVVGESGSGKSVAAQTVMGLLESPPARIHAGEIRFEGRNVLALPERERRKLRGRRISMVFQDALSALNPVYPVGAQIGEMYRAHTGCSRSEAWRRSVEMMERVRIPGAKARAHDYPHQFSGGMRQRIMIAIALSLEPDVLLADEPTTALDVTVQAQIMALLRTLQQESQMALVLITHDLGVVAEVADRVCVVYAGQTVEEGPVESLFDSPAHPYTQGLIESIPRGRAHGRLPTLPGSPPTLRTEPVNCPFNPRCPRARQVCVDQMPPLRPVVEERLSACHFAEEVIAGV
jgi:oligopeptide transport system ATP-binding protein